MIPQRIERRTYPYQEYALPIKLRNLFLLILLKGNLGLRYRLKTWGQNPMVG